MAKGQYEKWLEPENLVLLHGWKMQGLTDEQIAENIGVTARTLENWKSKHVQILQAIKGGKEVANFVIENELYKKAKSGNVTAMIFYLKNNYREKYTDDVTDPKLRKAQIRKANAEADMAEYNVETIKLEKESVNNNSVQIIDDIEGDDEDGTTSKTQE